VTLVQLSLVTIKSYLLACSPDLAVDALHWWFSSL